MKKTLISLIALALLLSYGGNIATVSAKEVDDINHLTIDGDEQVFYLYLNEEQKENLNKYEKIFINTGMINEFYLEEDGKFQQKLSFDKIKEKYKVSQTEIEFVINFIEDYNQKISIGSSSISPRFTIKNFRIYLSYNETQSYLGSAVTNGSIAVVGALAVLGATVGGPVGAVISGIAGIYGANYIVETTKSALRQRKGVWVGWGGIGIN